MATPIKFLVKIDKRAIDKKLRLEDALQKIKADYETVLGLTTTWDYETYDFTGSTFVPYNNSPNDLGLDFAVINQITKEARSAHGDKYDSVILCIDKDNWQAINPIGGWNMGLFYSGYQVEQVKIVDDDTWLYKIFAMEIAHSMDNFVRLELNQELAAYLGVQDYDEDVVHGRTNPPYVAFEYRYVLSQIGNIVYKCFAKRNERYTGQLNFIISLLQKLVALYRQLLILKGLKPSAVYLDSERSEHHHIAGTTPETMNTYSFKQGLLKGLKYFVIFLLPVLVDKLIVAYPEWAQLTLGGGLVMLVNWLKIKLSS